MGACASKTKKNKEKYLKNDVTNTKKNSIIEQVQQSSSVNADKFANVPFIDSEEKLTTTTPPPPPPTEQSIPPTNDNDERTTVKTNFETNVSYSSTETIDKLKQEVYTFLREKILPIKEEKEKLIDYVHKRIIGSTTDSTIIDESLEQCFNDIEQRQHPYSDNTNKIKKRLMNIVTVYVASQSSDNSFLKALYDKMGPSLDLNSLNAETSEHEVVNVTVTKTVRQVFVDGSSSLIPNPNHNSTTDTPNSVIHISNNEHNIPTDLPDDIRQQGHSYLPDKQTSLEDRYYNNQNFQEEFPSNDPDANNAATKIQAQFRGHRTRRNLDKIKQENQGTDQQEVYDHLQQSPTQYNEDQKSSPLNSARSQHEENDQNHHDKELTEDELNEQEKREQEHAAIAIQAKFRGYQARKNLPPFDHTNESGSQSNQQHQDVGFDFGQHKIEAGYNNEFDRTRIQRESTPLSEDFERHTQIPRDLDFDRELQQAEHFYDEDDMNDPNLDKAATRIQASYRGYKIRKELSTGSGQSNSSFEQQPPSTSPQSHDNGHNKNILSPSAEGNKGPVGEEEDDAAAAVKIQAAYRGYRARKDLEK